MAEDIGFEPTVGTRPTAVFKTAALNHSANPPKFDTIKVYDFIGNQINSKRRIFFKIELSIIVIS
jgi:hypothetical protein